MPYGANPAGQAERLYSQTAIQALLFYMGFTLFRGVADRTRESVFEGVE